MSTLIHFTVENGGINLFYFQSLLRYRAEDNINFDWLKKSLNWQQVKTIWTPKVTVQWRWSSFKQKFSLIASSTWRGKCRMTEVIVDNVSEVDLSWNTIHIIWQGRLGYFKTKKYLSSGLSCRLSGASRPISYGFISSSIITLNSKIAVPMANLTEFIFSEFNLFLLLNLSFNTDQLFF